MLRIGVDLGGTKTEIIAINNAGDIVHSKRVKSPQNDYRETLDNIVSLIRECERQTGHIATIGIGTPGTISTRTQTLKNSNSTWLNGKPLHRDLEEILDREIRIANDANCFTLSEAIDGAAANDNTVFGVIIGTGTGGGIVIDKKLLNGPNGITGEWGHNPLPWKTPAETPGPECYCGKSGCIETFLSGPGMTADFKRKTKNTLAPPEILELARDGNTFAIEILDRYYERMAKSLAHIINILDPDTIVLGGGMSNIEGIYEEIPKRWGNYVFSDSCETKLLKAKYGDASGVRGAAKLW
ncbi:MAG: ROK family protein [Gammaproteobacteria bacterium]|nr:ROK family protein [Gammaproteobacteria bacterium]